MEGSGSRSGQNNYGSGSRWPKHIRIRIRNTAEIVRPKKIGKSFQICMPDYKNKFDHFIQLFCHNGQIRILFWTEVNWWWFLDHWLKGGFFWKHFSLFYWKLLYVPPLRFHCVGGGRDRTQRTIATSALAVRRSKHSHPHRYLASAQPVNIVGLASSQRGQDGWTVDCGHTTRVYFCLFWIFLVTMRPWSYLLTQWTLMAFCYFYFLFSGWRHRTLKQF